MAVLACPINLLARTGANEIERSRKPEKSESQPVIPDYSSPITLIWNPNPVAKDVVMPALGMAQETGTLLKWFRATGEIVTKGEPLMEVETDKATVEIEAAASGVLANVTAKPGDVVPVGQTIAVIVNLGEAVTAPNIDRASRPVAVSPIAARVAAEHRLDLAQIKPNGGRVQKEGSPVFNGIPGQKRLRRAREKS
jgi:pyruvate/2-oxoglutarate dehydrogenase complex dihydrolipoamide acyltransferase (E2) component